jgi:hypothetical protein
MYAPLIRRHGIFCLEESDWWLRPDSVSTVVYLLEFLKQAPVNVPFVRGDVGTKEEFRYYVAKWRQRKYERFKILYLAFHGSPGYIYCGDRRRGGVALEELGEMLQGSCRGRVVHVGGCGTLRVAERRVESFLRTTKALAVCGYSRLADWLAAASFELVLFAALQEVPMTVRGMERARERATTAASGLAEQLRFRMYVRSDFL